MNAHDPLAADARPTLLLSLAGLAGRTIREFAKVRESTVTRRTKHSDINVLPAEAACFAKIKKFPRDSNVPVSFPLV